MDTEMDRNISRAKAGIGKSIIPRITTMLSARAMSLRFFRKFSLSIHFPPGFRFGFPCCIDCLRIPNFLPVTFYATAPLSL
ncbi:hypothetical protein BMS3Bbin07_00966 [bacterium BMS3Bbin07]|nr:hypothetical protein BMS3Bbin07_00966 [bacterium BMS3Bbin07]